MHDYHMHTHYCRHATGGLADYARAAREKGITEICITPHIPLPGFTPGVFNDRVRMDIGEFGSYLEELERTRALFPDMTILSGIEADFIEGREEQLAEFLSRHSFDLVLMSVHFVGGWPDGEWVFDFSLEGRTLARVYSDYFRSARKGIETGLFDCVAHLDLIKQPGRPVLETNAAEVEGILALCMERGMSVEINTSGTRKEIGEAYPSDDIVRLMIEHRVPLIVGSDAHAPSQVGQGFEELFDRFGAAVELLLVRYRGRRMVSGSSPLLAR
jgi:histidinol-phosphatase (PHP family)